MCRCSMEFMAKEVEMDTVYLKEFLILIEARSFVKAAEQISIPQPILSKHMKALEDELGVPLFIRSKRHIKLSEFGQTLQQYASEILSLEQESRMVLQQTLSASQQQIVIGMIPAVSYYNLIDILSSFKAEHPKLRLRFLEDETGQLIQLLRESKCDCAFIRTLSPTLDSSLTDTLDCIDYITDTLAVVLPDRHPLARESSIHLRQLRNETFLMLPEKSIMRNLCTKACRESGFEPIIGYTGRRADNIVELVRQGMGVSVLSKYAISQLNIEGISILDLDPPIQTYVKLAALKPEKRSVLTSQFMSFFQALPPHVLTNTKK